MKKIYTVLLTLFLCNCAVTHDARQRGSIDKSDKSVILYQGANDRKTLNLIKDYLYDSGFKVIISRGDIKEVNKKYGAIFKTERTPRYSMTVSSSHWKTMPMCFTGINYDIEIVDNTTGREVISLGGTSCGREEIIKNLANAVSS